MCEYIESKEVQYNIPYKCNIIRLSPGIEVNIAFPGLISR